MSGSNGCGSMDLVENWDLIKSLFRDSFRSSFHFAVATVDENGAPHVTPIGSLMLGEPGRGFYFEKFARKLPGNLAVDNRVCVLAVNSSRWFWIKSLVKGEFGSLPALRLYGVAGELRPADEIALWQRRVRRARRTRGHELMWRDMDMVRDIRFNRMEAVHIGQMTRALWLD